MNDRRPLDATAVCVMVLLCLVWGVGHVAAKLAAQGISLVFQSGVRSLVAAFAYQCAVVAFASFLAWFWLLRKYLAARLSVFAFLTPLFGVLAGVLVLGEPLTPWFAAAALLVGAGIVLVNRRG